MLHIVIQCEPVAYYGLQHCVVGNEDAHLLMVDLRDPHIRLLTVLSSRNGVECNSVNHNGPTKDPTNSNCAPPYPLERLTAMFARYVAQGAVAIINTDYFGPDGDHGAQGLAVRNGVRLDGPQHGVTNDLAYTAPSLAFSPANLAVISIPGSHEAIERQLSTTYYNTVGGAPIIVANGQVVDHPCRNLPPGYDSDACSDRSQSVAGLTGDGRLILITARMDAQAIAELLVIQFSVHTALKFDSGRSAGLAWLDASGAIQEYYPRGAGRPLAEALLVFSQRI